MSTEHRGVVVIGDALIDEIRDASGVRELVGGAALNVAVGLRRLGVPATLIAMVGADAAGDHIREYLADHDVTLVESPSAYGSSRAIVQRAANGEPEYVFNEAAQRRSIRYSDAAHDAIAAAALVAVSCFPFDVEEEVQSLSDAVGDARLVIDPNPRAGLLHDADAFREALEDFGGTAKLIKIGDDDAQLLYGRPVAEVAPTLLRRYPYVLATEGRAGASVRVGDARWRHPTLVTPDAVVDTMGAGDAVFASVLADIATTGVGDLSWHDTLKRAMGIAAATIAQPGALLRLPKE